MRLRFHQLFGLNAISHSGPFVTSKGDVLGSFNAGAMRPVYGPPLVALSVLHLEAQPVSLFAVLRVPLRQY